MGDLNSEIIELEWINLFYSSIQGKPNVNEDIECFKKYNYSPFLYYRFNIIVEEDGLEKPKEITPDFILWNKDKEIIFYLFLIAVIFHHFSTAHILKKIDDNITGLRVFLTNYMPRTSHK